VCVGVEIDMDMTPERRAALLEHASDVLTRATVTMPDAQRDFCDVLGIDRPSRSFDVLAHPVTKEALGPVLAGAPA
jgi:hypothetical protein